MCIRDSNLQSEISAINLRKLFSKILQFYTQSPTKKLILSLGDENNYGTNSVSIDSRVYNSSSLQICTSTKFSITLVSFLASSKEYLDKHLKKSPNDFTPTIYDPMLNPLLFFDRKLPGISQLACQTTARYILNFFSEFLDSIDRDI